MKQIPPLVLAVAFAGCTSAPVATSTAIKPATAEQVATCTYLDDLTGASGRYGVFASSGAEKAREDLLKKAASIGATHVVWSDATTGYGGTSVEAKAYRCTDES